MRISIVQGGGFVPIVTTTVADSESLSSEDAETLRRRVDEAGLFGLSGGGGGERHPDRPSYRIIVEDGERQHQVDLDDAALPDAVRSLISWVGSVPGHEQRIAPPGRG